MVLNMQTDNTSVDNSCVIGLNMLNENIISMQMWSSNILYYSEAVFESGKSAEGTNLGWYVAIGSKMMDTWVNFFNVYDNCRFDYYMQSVGKASTTVTGGVGFITNAMGILLSGWANTATAVKSGAASSSTTTSAASTSNYQVTLDFNVLNQAMYEHDPYKVGEFIGTMLFQVISTELPTYSKVDNYPYNITPDLEATVKNSLF